MYYELSLYHFMIATFYIDSLLLLLFIILKLFKYTTMSWLWVISPIWITFLTIIFLTFIITSAFYVINKKGAN